MKKKNEFVAVVFDARVRAEFDYRPPDGISADAAVGCRVLAPLRKRMAVGLAVAARKKSAVAESKIKPLARIFSDMPPLSAELITLIRRTADDSFAPLGVAAFAALPKIFRRPAEFRALGGLALASSPTIKIPPRQKIAHEILKRFQMQNSAVVAESEIRKISPSAGQIANRLIADGILIRRPFIAEIAEENPPINSPTLFSDDEISLTDSQNQAAREIESRMDFSESPPPNLLMGKGRAAVFAKLSAAAFAGGKRALILAPEVSLAERLADELRRLLPGRKIIVLHGELSGGEQARRWLLAQAGIADAVVGTRLAVFAPLPNIGLIAVDEEQDDSYREEEGAHYSARDLAIFRGNSEAATVVLGAATPSLETYAKAAGGDYRLFRIGESEGKKSPILPLDVVGEKLFHGISPRLIAELRRALAKEKRGLILTGRLADAWFCRHCRRAFFVGNKAAIRCPDCGSESESPLGIGSEKAAAALRTLFPKAKIVRIDRDSRADWESSADILVGAKMPAMISIRPPPSVVGVVGMDGDIFHSGDFRAPLRALTLILQAAGQGDASAKTLVQTRFANRPPLSAIFSGGLESCWRILLDDRRRAQLPPFSRQAALFADGQSSAQVRNLLARARCFAEKIAPPQVEIFDAVPSRIGGRNRYHLLAQSADFCALDSFLRRWMSAMEAEKFSGVRWSLEINPNFI